MTNPTNAELHESWDAYREATQTYLQMEREQAPRLKLFQQAMLVQRLHRDFAAAFNRSCGSGPRPVAG